MTDRHTFRAYYAGRILRGDKVYHRYVRADEPDTDMAFGRNIAHGYIGAVYDLTESEPGSGSVYTRGPDAPRYAGDGLPDSRLTEWVAADREAEAEQNRRSALRKASDPFAEVLDQVAAASVNMTRPQRRALAVTIMERLWL